MLADISIGGFAQNTALVLCSLRRGPNNIWLLKNLSVPGNGREFKECMPLIRSEVDRFLDAGLICEPQLSMDKTFQMKKNDRAQLPADLKSVIIALGWSCQGSIDLDTSIVGLDVAKEKRLLVYYGAKTAPGVWHRGDNTTGAGSGDDEMIQIDLSAVPPEVAELYVTVNVYTQSASFKDVYDAYVRLAVAGSKRFQPKHELARYPLDGKLTCRGIVFCRLARANSTWSLDALAWGCQGANASDPGCMNVVRGKSPQIPITPCAPSAKAIGQRGAVESTGCCRIF